MTKMSTATEKALKAKAEMETLFQAAIDEQLAIIKEAEGKLAELGYTGSTKKKSGTRQKDPNKPCSLCNFLTEPPHDARAHRSQKKKAAFSKEELDERGFKKR